MHTTAVIDPPDQPEREVRGEAWFRADDDAKRLEWGSEGENDYHGSLTVSLQRQRAPSSPWQLHSQSEHEGVDASIDETLEKIDSLL